MLIRQNLSCTNYNLRNKWTSGNVTWQGEKRQWFPQDMGKTATVLLHVKSFQSCLTGASGGVPQYTWHGEPTSTVCAVLLALQDCCSCGSTWRWALWARVVVSCKFHVAAGIVSTFGQGFLQNKPWHIWDATSSDLHKDAQYRHTFWFSFWTSTIRQVMFSCAFSSTAAKSRYLRLS